MPVVHLGGDRRKHHSEKSGGVRKVRTTQQHINKQVTPGASEAVRKEALGDIVGQILKLGGAQNLPKHSQSS